MINKFYVYVLIDPSDNIPFYVGKGCGNRMMIHEKSVLKGKITNNNFSLTSKIQSILNSGNSIIYKKSHQNLLGEDALIKESDEIKSVGRKDLGMGPLCNLTDGGEGIANVSEEIKKKISNSLKGRIFSDEHKQNLKLAALNRTKEHINKIASKNKGKHQTTETKLKISQSKKGKPSKIKGIVRSKEIKQKISNSVKRLYENEDYRNAHAKKMKEISSGSKYWKFIDPNKHLIEIFNLSNYCKVNNLYYECMKQVGRGVKKSYRGWKKYEEIGN